MDKYTTLQRLALIPAGELDVLEFFTMSHSNKLTQMVVGVVVEHNSEYISKEDDGWLITYIDIDTTDRMILGNRQMVRKYVPTELEKMEMVPFIA